MTLCVALERWRSFKTDDQLKRAVRQLYEGCMSAIRGLGDVLNHKPGHSTRERFAFVVKQALPGHEADMIDQILQPVARAKASVDKNIDRLDRLRSEETHQYTAFSVRQGIATHEVVEGTKILVTDASVQAEARHRERTAQLGHLQATVQRTGSNVSSDFSDLKRQVSQIQSTLGDFKTMLMEGTTLIPQPMMEYLEMMHTSFYHLNGEQAWKRSKKPSLKPVHIQCLEAITKITPW